MNREELYIQKRIWKARIQSIAFYVCRIFPIRKRKIVFCCIEGTTGYSCNPKYIAEELIRRNKKEQDDKKKYELVWLVNDTAKQFPKEIKVVRNSLWNRAYQLSTAHFWIDNSRKQLEVRKRKGQIYIQTWHAKLGFKPTCLDRGASFSKIAYLVSKHDSDLVDYWLSNSDWYDKTLKTGSLYEGKVLRTGSPRCDILVHAAEDEEFKRNVKLQICKQFNISIEERFRETDINQIHFMMYAPTFRGGSQGTDRTVEVGDHFPDYAMLKDAMEQRFGGKWVILLRLHPQLVARHLDGGMDNPFIVDASRVDDMYEILAGCDAFLTDYSSAAFDAAVMRIPVFLYADDYGEYERERGKLLWDLRDKRFPFILSMDNRTLRDNIRKFDEQEYQLKMVQMFHDTGMSETGNASQNVVQFMANYMR